MRQSPLTAMWRTARGMLPLATIILLHVAFFYALQSGLLRAAAEASLPKVVLATFITPPPQQPEPPRPAPTPAPPRTVPVVKKSNPPPVAPVNATPSPNAITAPPAPPAPPLPAEAPAAVVAPPVAPAPAAPAQPRVVSSGIEYIEAPRPVYPPLARRMGEEGQVTLRVLVNERGRAEQAEVQKSSGSARLDEAARQAALRAVFKPHVENGQPVSVFAIVPIKFQLDS